jgi:hypothetical protein
MHFNIGLSSDHLKISIPIASNDQSMKTCHWAIVIESPTMATPRIIEIAPDAQLQTVYLTYAPAPSDSFANLQPVATYTGDLEDFDQVLRHHPMRNKIYSACFNNCQHFAAAFFVFLEALAHDHPKKSFVPAPGYQELITNVFEGEDEHLWHRPNIFLQVAQAMGVKTALGVTALGVTALGVGGITLAASRATVTLTVPAPGIAGWFGFTIPAIAPAWYARTATTTATICAVAAFGIGVGYLYKRSVWKRETTFVDPRRRGGFPTGDKPPINANELDGTTGSRGRPPPSSYVAILSAAPILF